MFASCVNCCIICKIFFLSFRRFRTIAFASCINYLGCSSAFSLLRTFVLGPALDCWMRLNNCVKLYTKMGWYDLEKCRTTQNTGYIDRQNSCYKQQVGQYCVKAYSRGAYQSAVAQKYYVISYSKYSQDNEYIQRTYLFFMDVIICVMLINVSIKFRVFGHRKKIVFLNVKNLNYAVQYGHRPIIIRLLYGRERLSCGCQKINIYKSQNIPQCKLLQRRALHQVHFMT